MSGNYKGGQKILSAAFERLQDINAPARQLNVRNLVGNDIAYISADGQNACGFLSPAEGREWLHTSPFAVYVKGTAGNVVYYDFSE
jgi:hypothetical protein